MQNERKDDEAPALLPGKGPARLRAAALAVLCAAMFCLAQANALSRWRAGQWYLADIGHVQALLVNTWHGQFMLSPFEGGNFFGFHFSPFLLLLVPWIWLSHYAIPLVAGYNLALSLAAIPVYLLARKAGLSAWTGFAAAAWFFGNHFIGSIELSYHFESWYILFALGAICAWKYQLRWVLRLLTILAISVKEDCALWMALFFIYASFQDRSAGSSIPLRRRETVRLLALCVAWGIAAAIIMAWIGSNQKANALEYMKRMGGIHAGIDTLEMFGLIVASGLGLCLFDWRTLLLLATPTVILLGNFPFTRTLQYYYSYPFLPFLALGTITGAARIVRWARQRSIARPVEAILAILLAGAGTWMYFQPTRTAGERRLPVPETLHDRFRRHVAADILPTTPPLALEYGLWGITPWRPDTVFLKPGTIKPRDYIFVDFKSPHGLQPGEFIQTMHLLRKQVNDGKRRVLLDQHDILILSPETSSTIQDRYPATREKAP